MHHPTDRIAHTTAFVAPVVEHWLDREIAQCVHPMKDRSDDPSHHERTLLPRSYISLPSRIEGWTNVVCFSMFQKEIKIRLMRGLSIVTDRGVVVVGGGGGCG